MSILGKQGVTPEMEFQCVDCRDITTGREVLDGTYLYIVEGYPRDPKKSVWRCECCQDDLEDRE